MDGLELHLHLRPQHALYGRPLSTIGNVRELWEYLWRKIEQVRQSHDDVLSRPRLRTLRVYESQFVGDEPLPSGAPRSYLRRYLRDVISFEARLSECDHLARRGYADVVCLELEGLYNRYGRGQLHEELQVSLMEQTTLRAYQARMQAPRFAIANHTDLLRPLNTPLRAMVDRDYGKS